MITKLSTDDASEPLIYFLVNQYSVLATSITSLFVVVFPVKNINGLSMFPPDLFYFRSPTKLRNLLCKTTSTKKTKQIRARRHFGFCDVTCVTLLTHL